MSSSGGETLEPVPKKSQAEEGERMRTVRQYLDRAVDNLIKKLEQKHFINEMPKELDPEFLFALQNRFASNMKKRMRQYIDERLNESDLATKLNDLDQLVKDTEHSINHLAWRPRKERTVESSVIAHDLMVSSAHKEKLEHLLNDADTECADLCAQIKEAERRMKDNQTVLSNMEKSYDVLLNNLVQDTNL
eukprot:TRINITY_DN9105_c0_g1_i1.p1 TRINITY_DN9105_c0_g1~~TRINITY_DN9105_c0_g1_i1.p1  ORF type:complete len:215 (-),score=41.10 TRINITY_DN9105_c0_g1_i1:128-700(-)